MPVPLNPFLAAFFRSPFAAAQCNPPSNHILLVPVTEILLTHCDADAGWLAFPDLPNIDEYLVSHVIRMPHPRVAAAAANAAGGKDGIVNLREMRGKAKPYATVNGRGVVIKDSMVYSNKGFKTMNHALLVGDAIWYSDGADPKQWLIYYISRPLLGAWEERKLSPAILPPLREPRVIPAAAWLSPPPTVSDLNKSDDEVTIAPRKKDVKSFHDLLNHFPVIARQMQPGLDKIFREFREAFEQRFPPPPTASHVPDPVPDGPIKTAMKKARMNSASANPKPPAKAKPPASSSSVAGAVSADVGPKSNNVDGSNAKSSSSNVNHEGNGGDSSTAAVTTSTERVNGSNSSTHSGNGSQSSEDFFPEDDEHVMRASLESAVTTAIDVFQGVDKQQLSLLGATTDLTGPLVERLIERYISENVHHIIFPRLSALKRQQDLELEAKIRQMDSIDLSQLGMDIDGSSRNKREVTLALGHVVDEFRKMSSTTCPQDMLAILLATVKSVSQLTAPTRNSVVSGNDEPAGNSSRGDTTSAALPAPEKPLLTINADTLVSLLLYIIIRAQQRHLLARFVYMRHFIFIDDVDSGEMGYALSTFEAVLAYLARDSSSLRRASRRNKSLWDTIAKGDLVALRSIIEPDASAADAVADVDSDDGCENDDGTDSASRTSSADWPSSFTTFSFSHGRRSPSSSRSSRRSSIILSDAEAYSQGSDLSHVFPFQAKDRDGSVEFSLSFPIKRTKKVALDTRSMSSSSEISYHSRAASLSSNMDGSVEGDLSVERLAKTHNALGESLLMMAVQNEQVETLRYLLTLEQHFPVEFVLEDSNHEETTLLSAAVQLGNHELITTVLDFLAGALAVDEARMVAYFAQQDTWGRSVAHYLFHAPFLIKRYGGFMPWRQRDKNGQTPLFALCRSYDHAEYHAMVQAGLRMATMTQGDAGQLHVEDHVDGRGNTLLHILNDAPLAQRILQTCDVDVNAVNDKRFTPFMVASKYGRFSMVQTLFRDARMDRWARELRGLTAVELAKDDEVRNKIDDLTLLSMPAGPEGKTTAVVRSYFVEDASVRFVVKSGQAVSDVSYAVTTCRRSQTDFEHLTKLLALENPASWIPVLTGLRSPFQLPSRPSRSLLRDLQQRMDWFLRMMLMHPTFAQHEMLWEFVLAPEIQPDMMAQRSRLKAETRAEKVRDELDPLEDVREVEQFVNHARDLMRQFNFSTKSVIRRTHGVSFVTQDLYEAAMLLSKNVGSLAFLPATHTAAMEAFAYALVVPQSSALGQFQAAVLAVQASTDAMLMALARPPRLILQIQAARKQVEREYQSLSRSTRWPLGLLDEARQHLKEDREARARQSEAARQDLARELRYSQQTVASELAGWQEMHGRIGRRAIRDLARGMLVQERDRLAALQRALRHLRTPAPDIILADVPAEDSTDRVGSTAVVNEAAAETAAAEAAAEAAGAAAGAAAATAAV